MEGTGDVSVKMRGGTRRHGQGTGRAAGLRSGVAGLRMATEDEHSWRVRAGHGVHAGYGRGGRGPGTGRGRRQDVRTLTWAFLAS